MIKTYLQPLRIPFLILTPACVLLGVSTAIWQKGIVNVWDVNWVMVGAVSAHISVNTFNEYFDYRSGLDALTIRTPFSGGSGAIPSNPKLNKPTFIIAWTTFCITALIGLYFAHTRGWAIIPLGIVGLFLLFAYTPWLSRIPFLCLISPGLGFGIFMVMGTHYSLTSEFSRVSFIASLIPFFLVNNLLLLNQFPDVSADSKIGRNNYPILIGRYASAWIYSIFLILVYITITLGVLMDYLPPATLLGMLTLFMAIPAIIGPLRNADNIEKLAPSLGLNVLLNVLTPLLTAIGFVIS